MNLGANFNINNKSISDLINKLAKLNAKACHIRGKLGQNKKIKSRISTFCDNKHPIIDSFLLNIDLEDWFISFPKKCKKQIFKLHYYGNQILKLEEYLDKIIESYKRKE